MIQGFFSTKRTILTTFLSLLLLGVGGALSSAAPAPSVISYQGFLTSATGTAQTGTTTITIRIYDAATGGTLLYEELHPTTPITNGYFTVQIGSVGDVNGGTTATSITDLTFDRSYYVTVELASPFSTGEMTLTGGARSQLGTVPFATVAYGALQATSSSSLTAQKGRMYFNTNDNQLYIYDGSSWNAVTIEDTSTSFTSLTIASTTANGTTPLLSISTSSSIFTVLANGNIGVGTTTPSAKVYVDQANSSFGLTIGNHVQPRIDLNSTQSGAANWNILNEGNVNRFAIRQTGGGPQFYIESGAVANSLIVSSSSNIGIGSTTPNFKLTVVGGGYFGGNLIATGTLAISGQTTLNTASATGITSTNIYGTNGIITNATATNLFATEATFTNATSSTFFSSLLSATNAFLTTLTATDATFTRATSTDLTVTGNFTSASTSVTNLSTTNSTTTSSFISSLVATLANITDLVVGNSTTTNAVITNAQVTNATSTLLTTTGTTTLATLGGNVGIGTTTPRATLSVFSSTAAGTTSIFNVATTSDILSVLANGSIGIKNSNPQYALDVLGSTVAVRYFADSSAIGGIFRTNYARGTMQTPSIVNSEDRLGVLLFSGYDGSSYTTAARIDGNMDGSAATGDMPGRLTFWTTAASSTTAAERMRITSAGNVGIGTTSPGYKLSVIGDGYFGGNLTATGTLNISGQTTLATASTTAITVSGQTFLQSLLSLANASSTGGITATSFYGALLGTANLSTLTVTGQSSLANASTSNLSTTNLVATGTLSVSGQSTLTTASATALTATTLYGADAMITNATSSTFFATLLNAVTAIITDLTATNATATNLVTTNSTSTNSFISSLVATLANITDLVVGNSTTTNAVITNATIANATATNLGATNANITNGDITNLTTVNATTTGSSVVTGTSTLATTTVEGFLGLGINNPIRRVHIYGTTATTSQIFSERNDGGNNVAVFAFNPFGSVTNGEARLAIGVGNSTADIIAKMVIGVSGNVGIGVTAPTDRLQVAGNITPSVNSLYSLGSSSLRFLNTFTNNIFASSSLITNATTTGSSVVTGTSTLATTTISSLTITGNTNLTLASTTALSATTLYGALIGTTGTFSSTLDVAGDTTLGLASSTALTATNLFSTQASITNASTTGLTASSLYFNNASSTGGLTLASLFGANLTACNTSTEKLLWANGTFTCGTDAGGSGGTITSLNGSSVASQTLATSTLPGVGLDLLITSSTTNGVHTFALSPQAGYSIPLTASSTNWNSFFDTPVSYLTAGANVLFSGTSTISLTPNPTFTTGTFSTVVSGTSTLGNASATALTATNLFATDATFTNATSSTFFSSLLSATTAFITTLTATDATFTRATSTDLTVTGNFTSASTSVANLSTTNSTSTSFFASTLTALTGTISSLTSGALTSGTIIATSSLSSQGTLSVSGQSSLANASTSNLSTTNLTATGTLSVSGQTTLSTASATALTVSGQTVLGNASTTALSATTLYGALIGTTGTFSSTLNVTGNTTLSNASTSVLTAPSLFSTQANITNASTSNITTSGNLYLSGLTAGSVPFIGTGGLVSQNNANFFFDNTNTRLGIGTGTPIATLSVRGAGSTNPFVVASSTGVQLLTLTTQGRLGLGTSSPISTFSLTGTAGTNPLTIASSTGLSLMSIDQAGRLVVGTTTSNITLGNLFVGTTTLQGNISSPTALKIIGNIDNTATTTFSPRLITSSVSLGGLNNPRSIAISGNYAYVANNSSPTSVLGIMDISNPTNPTFVATTSFTVGTAPYALAVSGKYVHIAGGGFRTFDISNPTNPTLVGSSSITTSLSARALTASGNFVYLTDSSADMFFIYDVSNPAAPRQIGSIPLAFTSGEEKLVVQGKYVYVAHGLFDDKFSIIDVSSPSSPFVATTTSVADDPFSIAVSGRYLYVSVVDAVNIYDIASSTSPSLLSTVTLSGSIRSMTVTGRYLYAMAFGAANLFTIDVSSPTSPILLSTTTVPSSTFGFAISGRHLYGAEGTTGMFVVDLGGMESTSAVIHSLNSGNLAVGKDAFIGGNLNVITGLTVGNGGFFSQGNSGVYGSFSVGTSSQPLLLADASNNRINIGTSTGLASLFVQGTSTLNPFTVASSTGASLFTVLANGNVGIGNANPTTKLSVDGGTFVINTPTGDQNSIYIDGGTTNRLTFGPGATASRIGISGVANFINMMTAGELVLSAFPGANVETQLSGGSNFVVTGGSLGVGTTTPSSLLSVGSTTANGMSRLFSVGTTSEIFSILANGKVGVGTSNPVQELQIEGNTSYGAYTGSDFSRLTGITDAGGNYGAGATFIRYSEESGTGADGLNRGGNIDFYTHQYGVTSAQRIRIQANGNVGIGTSTPVFALDVFKSGSAAPLRLLSTTYSGVRMDTNSANPDARNWFVGANTSTYGDFSIKQGVSLGEDPASGLDRLYISPGGNIGLGTTTPGSLLNLYSSAPAVQLSPSAYGGTSYASYFGSRSGAQGVLQLGNNNLNDIVAGNTDPGGALRFIVNNTNTFPSDPNGIVAMTLSSSGNVGISTSTPTSLLSVASTSASGTSRLLSVGTTSEVFTVLANGGVGIGTSNPAYKLDVDGSVRNAGYLIGVDTLGGGNIRYLFANDGGSSFVSLGNFGIGTSTPSSKLFVDGAIRNSNSVNNSGDSGILIASGDRLGFDDSGTRSWTVKATGGNLDFNSGDGNGFAQFNYGLIATGRLGIGTTTPSASLSLTGVAGVSPLVVASSSGATLLSLLQNGNVGIGTLAPTEKLDVNGYARVNGVRIDPSIGIDQATYFSAQPYIEAGTFPYDVNYGTPPTYVQSASTTLPFSKVALNTSALEFRSDFIPVQSGETLYGEIYAMRETGSTGDPGVFYMGIARYDKDKNPIATNSGIEYFVAAAETVPQNSTWTKYSGNYTLPTSHAPFSGSDGGPVRYIQVIILVNYNTGTIPTYWGGATVRRVTSIRDSGNVAFNGNVGIGTTTPDATLSVAGTFRNSGNFVLAGGLLDGTGTTVTSNANAFNVNSSNIVLGNNSTDAVSFSDGTMYLSGNGNVGIGTTTAGSKLTVEGNTRVIGNIDNTTGVGVNPVVMGSVTTGSNATSIAVSGRYVYVANSGSNTVSVVDASNSSSPVVVGTVSSGLSSPSDVVASGRYIYVVNAGNSTVSVVDVSNPTSPVIVGSVSTGGSSAISIAVSGRYVYVTNSSSNTLSAIDVSNPSSPLIVGIVSTGGTNANSVAVSGRYAYVTNGANNIFSVIDVSTPSAPSLISSINPGQGPTSVSVSGRYAYVTNFVDSSLAVIDISNPSSPVVVGTGATGLSPRKSYISGRYVYVVNQNASSLSVIDVSVSAAPVSVGLVATGSAPRSVSVSGRYAYVANANSSTMSVIDIGGLETSGATIASLEAGTAQVRNDLTVQGGIFTQALNAVSAYVENLSAKVLSLSSLALGAASNVATNALLSLNLATSGTELVTKNTTAAFSVTGSTATVGVATSSNMISLSLASTTSIGNGTMTAGPSLATGSLGAGGHAIQRPDGKYLIVNGGGVATTNIYDPITNTFTAGPNLNTGNANTGSHSFQRPDGKFVIVNAGASNTTNIYDPVANTFTAGPTLNSIANAGAHSVQRPDGKFLVVKSNGGTTAEIYDPVANSFGTGPTLSSNTGEGSHALQRPDGTFLIISGNNSTATNIYDPITNTSAAGPTLTASARGATHSIQRPNGTFLIILGNGTATNIYDPITNTIVSGPSLTGGSIYFGGHSIQRPDGTFLVIKGNISSGTNIYDPITNTFTAGPTLASGSAYSGAISIQRPDGKYLIVNGGGVATTNIYDPSYVMSGVYESEDMLMTDLNPSSVLNFTTNGEGRIDVAIKTATSTAALAASYTTYATTTSGSKILPVSGAQYAKVSVTLTRPIPTNRQPHSGTKESKTWLGESDTKYQRSFANPILYSFNISNQKGYHVTNTDFGTNSASTTLTSNATSGPVVSGLMTGNDGLTLPYSSTNNLDLAKGVFTGGPILASGNSGIGTFSIQRPDGKYLVVNGGSTATTNILDPVTMTFTAGPSLASGTVQGGGHAIQRPDGKFLIVNGNNTTTTNVYDPIANTMSVGPAVVSGTPYYGANSLQRPDGKFLIIAGNTSTATNIYDPITNTMTAGPNLTANAYVGSFSIQRPDGKFLIIVGNTVSTTNIYDPISNTMTAGPNLASYVGWGGHAVQRPDGKIIIVHGAGLSSTTLYDPSVIDTSNTLPVGPNLYSASNYGAHAIQRPDGTYLFIAGGAGTGTSIYDPNGNTFYNGNAVVSGNIQYNSHSIHLPDGRFLVINGDGSTATNIYNAGYLVRGYYESEFINDTTLDSNSTFIWKGNADAYKSGVVSVRVRTATSTNALQTATWRTLPVSGSRINPGTSETWMQVKFEMNRPIANQSGIAKTVIKGESVYYNRFPLTTTTQNQASVFVKPTIYSYAIQKQEGQDLATFQVNGNSVFRFSATGDAYTSAGGSWNAGGADVAEYFPTEDGLLEPGDIVSVSSTPDGLVTMTTEKYDDRILGIVTTAPGLRLGSDDIGANQGKQPIALAGRVPVKVSLENGVIKKGDYLTSSSRPGFAMKALDAGRVIGIALEDYTLEMDTQNNGAGKVLTFVNPHFYLGSTLSEKVNSQFSRFAVMMQRGFKELGVTLADNGNVGIGVESPLSRFQVNGDIRLGLASSTAGSVIFQNAANGYTTILRSSTSSLTSNLTFTLPDTIGTASQALTTDGEGNLSFKNVAILTGTSTSNQLLRFLDDGTVTNSSITDDNGAITIRGTASSSPLRVLSSTDTPLFTLDQDGNVSIKGSITVASTNVATRYLEEEPLVAGDIVTFSTSTATSTTIRKSYAGEEAVGVVATSSGIILGSTEGTPVAVSGTVLVNVSNENGDIKQGDYLTISTSTPGYAMKLTENGYSLGRALTSSATTSTSSLILISLEQRDRVITLSSLEGLDFVDASSTLPTLTVRETLTLRLSQGYSVVKEYVAVSVRGVTGYFDTLFAKEIFSDKVEAEVICLKDETGETCINKAKLDSLLLLDPRQSDMTIDPSDSNFGGDDTSVLGTSTESVSDETSSTTESGTGSGSITEETAVPSESTPQIENTQETSIEQGEVVDEGEVQSPIEEEAPSTTEAPSETETP